MTGETRHEIVACRGIELLARRGSVDRANIAWMAESLFLQALAEQPIPPGGLVLDLGAHVGSFALVAARDKRCAVIGYEPDAESLALARASALLNGLDGRVAFERCAVAGHDGEVALNEATENWGHTILAAGGPYNVLTGRSVAVPVVSLDTVMRRLPQRRCDFLKFNIEGAEYAMLEQASEETLQAVAAMAGEVHYDLGLGDFGPCLRKLADCGFAAELVPQGELRAILLARRR